MTNLIPFLTCSDNAFMRFVDACTGYYAARQEVRKEDVVFMTHGEGAVLEDTLGDRVDTLHCMVALFESLDL